MNGWDGEGACYRDVLPLRLVVGLDLVALPQRLVLRPPRALAPLAARRAAVDDADAFARHVSLAVAVVIRDIVAAIRVNASDLALVKLALSVMNTRWVYTLVCVQHAERNTKISNARACGDGDAQPTFPL